MSTQMTSSSFRWPLIDTSRHAKTSSSATSTAVSAKTLIPTLPASMPALMSTSMPPAPNAHLIPGSVPHRTTPPRPIDPLKSSITQSEIISCPWIKPWVAYATSLSTMLLCALMAVATPLWAHEDYEDGHSSEETGKTQDNHGPENHYNSAAGDPSIIDPGFFFLISLSKDPDADDQYS